ncbi:MAG: hypothetical protein IT555_10145 [Acetobacteraceae bacterium]|nr:hypothetical protein [Acetobacteraceae bacterium]
MGQNHDTPNPSAFRCLPREGCATIGDCLNDVADAIALLAALSCSEVTIQPRALNLIHDTLREAHTAAAAALETGR